MSSLLRRLFGTVSRQPKTRASQRARLDVETLDQRLLPSTVPNLTFVQLALDFGPLGSYGSYGQYGHRTLTIIKETDNGNGTGSFSGIFLDNNDGFTAQITGSLKSTPPSNPAQYPYQHFFALSYSGIATSPYGNLFSEVSGSGTFMTTNVNAVPGAYRGNLPDYNPSVQTPSQGVDIWDYRGSDTEIASSFQPVASHYAFFVITFNQTNTDYEVWAI